MHGRRSSQLEESPAILGGKHSSRNPRRPHLHRVLEAQCSRVHTWVTCSLCPQQSDHVVGQQMNPHLLLVHLGRLAGQHAHARGGLEVAQVEFHVPATWIQIREFVFANLPEVLQCGEQHLVAHSDFTHSQRSCELPVLRDCHPIWMRFRLGPLSPRQVPERKRSSCVL